MAIADMHGAGDFSSDRPSSDEPAARLSLYVARSTPNSMRAKQNLAEVLQRLRVTRRAPELEIIDVFSEPRRAATDGVVVTPTLIGHSGTNRIVLIGDLSNQAQLEQTLVEMMEVRARP